MKIYKFKMYSNHGNRELQQTIDSHAWVWNHFVALCRRYYALYNAYPGKKALMRHLTKLKRLPLETCIRLDRQIRLDFTGDIESQRHEKPLGSQGQ